MDHHPFKASDRAISTLAVSLLVGSLLSEVRGGFAIGSFVLLTVGAIVLGVLGQTLLRRESLTAIETALRHLPLANFVRCSLVFIVMVVLVVWSGPVITGGTYSGWLIAVIVWVLSPAIVCPLAPRYPIPIGLLSAGCTAYSLALQNSRLYSHSRELDWSHVFSGVSITMVLVVWCIASALSLLVSIPVDFHRRSAQSL